MEYYGKLAQARMSQEAEEQRKRRELLAFAETQPSALYEQSISGFGRPVYSFLRPRYGQVYGQYMTELIRQAQEGMKPDLKFSEFLKKYDFMRDYMAQPYQQRGGYEARRLAPRARQFPY